MGAESKKEIGKERKRERGKEGQREQERRVGREKRREDKRKTYYLYEKMTPPNISLMSVLLVNDSQNKPPYNYTATQWQSGAGFLH